MTSEKHLTSSVNGQATLRVVLAYLASKEAYGPSDLQRDMDTYHPASEQWDGSEMHISSDFNDGNGTDYRVVTVLDYKLRPTLSVDFNTIKHSGHGKPSHIDDVKEHHAANDFIAKVKVLCQQRDLPYPEKEINEMVSEFLSTHEFGEFGGSLRTYGTIINRSLEEVEEKLDNDVDEYASPTLDQDVGFKVLAEVLKAVQYGLMHLKDKMDPSSPLESVYLNGTPSDDPSDDRRNRIYQRLVTKLSPAMAPPGVTVHPAPPYYHLKKTDGSIPVLADF